MTEAEPLAEAYVFLRNVEHRLQLHRDLQVHRLPSDPETRRRIARSLGFADAAAPDGSVYFADRVGHRLGKVVDRLHDARPFTPDAASAGR